MEPSPFKLPTAINGLEIQNKVIGNGTHSKVSLGNYYMSPVAVKEFFDNEAFQREFEFYKRVKANYNHPCILTVIGFFQNEKN
jgi:hypothetical protein